MKNEFKRQLESLINRYSKENESNTPDFILAKYLVGCLEAFNQATKEREKWYGRPEFESIDKDPRRAKCPDFVPRGTDALVEMLKYFKCLKRSFLRRGK